MPVQFAGRAWIERHYRLDDEDNRWVVKISWKSLHTGDFAHPETADIAQALRLFIAAARHGSSSGAYEVRGRLIRVAMTYQGNKRAGRMEFAPFLNALKQDVNEIEANGLDVVLDEAED